MGTTPFVPSAKGPNPGAKVPPGTDAKLPNEAEELAPFGTNVKLPQQRLSAAERVRRLEEAKAFLRLHLARGPQPARTLLKAANAAGIAERTLHRAKDLLLVTTERAGGYAGHGQWIWYPSPASALSSVSAGGREAASPATHRR